MRELDIHELDAVCGGNIFDDLCSYFCGAAGAVGSFVAGAANAVGNAITSIGSGIGNFFSPPPPPCGAGQTSVAVQNGTVTVTYTAPGGASGTLTAKGGSASATCQGAPVTAASAGLRGPMH